MLKSAFEFVKNYKYQFIIKPVLLSLTVIFLVFTFLILKTGSTEAHLYVGYSTVDNLKAIPEDKYPCDGDGLNPEFHSLRPYQAAPCGDSNKTLFCFNNYQIEESVQTTWSPECVDHGAYYSCPPEAGDEEIEKIYSVDGEYATFPIMGNTEQVRNSQSR